MSWRWRERRGAAPVVSGLVTLAALTLASATVGTTMASFVASVSGIATPLSTARVFPTALTVPAWDVRDASGTGEVNASYRVAFAGDGLVTQTSAWSTSFTATRYLQFDYNVASAPALATSGVAFAFTYASSNNNTTCFYFDVRRRSTGNVVATHGTATDPVSCNAGTTLLTATTPLTEVTSSDVANDLRVRVYETNSGSLTTQVDAAVVTGSTPYKTFTLYPTSYTDASSGTATVSTWPLTRLDGTVYGVASNWTNQFATTKYLKFAFPGYVPSEAVVRSVTFNHTYRDQDGISACYYFEVYSGSTLVATHGSASAPVSCNNGASYVTDAVPLPEITTPALANALTAKVYVKDSSGSKKTQHDVVTLMVDYWVP